MSDPTPPGPPEWWRNGDDSAAPPTPPYQPSGPAPYRPSGPAPYQPSGGPTPYGGDDTRPIYGQANGGPGGPGYPPPIQYGGVPPRKTRKAWLLGGSAAAVVALVAGGAVALTSNDGDGGADPAAADTPRTTAPTTVPEPTTPVPTGTFTDGLTTGSPTKAPTQTERQRTLKDVDRGIKVYDDVYVQPVKGWRRFKTVKQALSLVNPGRGALFVAVIPAGFPAVKGVPTAVQLMVDADKLAGVKKGPARKVAPANSNIAEQAQMSFSGRVRTNGVSVTLSGTCTTMTGVESIHNVTVHVCVEAPKADSGPGFRDGAAMLASVARSI